MPCYDDRPFGPSERTVEDLEDRLRIAEAVACGLVRHIGANQGNDQMVKLMQDWDEHESGLSRLDVIRWIVAHRQNEVREWRPPGVIEPF